MEIECNISMNSVFDCMTHRHAFDSLMVKPPRDVYELPEVHIYTEITRKSASQVGVYSAAINLWAEM